MADQPIDVDDLLNRIRTHLRDTKIAQVPLSRDEAEALVKYFDDLDSFRENLFG